MIRNLTLGLRVLCLCLGAGFALAQPVSAGDRYAGGRHASDRHTGGRDDYSGGSRLERRRDELFIADDVLDPSLPALADPFADDSLRAVGNSDSVLEEPLDADAIDDEVLQKVLAGEQQDETDKAMASDHFDEATTPFKPAPDSVGDEVRDPVEW